MKRTPLHQLHKSKGASFTQLADWEIPGSFGDPVSEYTAATEGVVVTDRSCVGRFRATGKDMLDLLNRLSSNKLEELPPGTGKGSILPTNKGRVIDLLHIFARDDHLLLLTSPQTRERIAEWIDLYTFLEEAVLEDVTEPTAMVAVLGPQAADLLQRALGAPASQMEPYGSLTVSVGGHDVTLLRSDPLRAPGFDLVVAAEHAPEVWETLVAEGAVPIGEQTFDLLRIKEGVPRYGSEMSEELNPWEANLQEYINFEKGCYIGQEVILRLNTYKKVQRRLMALAFSGGATVAVGDRLHQGEQEAAVVTSVARRPTSGDLIGLGLVKRDFAKAETVLRAGDATATVRELPQRVPVAG